jgi:hypothetical protein
MNCENCKNNLELVDNLGGKICLGDIVINGLRDLTGKVVFKNHAIRIDGPYNKYHSSILIGDGGGTKHITVSRKGCEE